jgi:hypothetical protein
VLLIFPFTVALLTVILLISYTSQPASPTASITSPTASQPQAGGIYKVMIRGKSDAFGYPPLIVGAGRDYAPPFFDRLPICCKKSLIF